MADEPNEDEQQKQARIQAAKQKAKAIVHKPSATTTPTFDLDKTCAICREKLNNVCVYCQSSDAYKMDCAVVKGACNHKFHFHCVNRSYLKARTLCPLCDAEWEYKIVVE